MRQSLFETRQKVFSLICSQPGLRAGQIREKLGIVNQSGSTQAREISTISTCLQVLYLANQIRKEGTGPNVTYYPQAEGAENPRPQNKHREKSATTAFIHTIEIPKATLKVLVQAHIDADTPLEGAFGKAMLCAMKKLI